MSHFDDGINAVPAGLPKSKMNSNKKEGFAMVIKMYVFVPVPVVISEQPKIWMKLKWYLNSAQKADPYKVSASLVEYLDQKGYMGSARWN